ncbi:MAG: DinB family protein [Terriglobales bacterium]
MKAISSLRTILEVVPDRLGKVPRDSVESKPTPTNWSPKEELGHLLDSAANNHQRIVRAQFEDNPAMPGYEQNRWVAVHAYQRRDWKELTEVWQALNRQLLAAAEAVPDSAWLRTLTVAGSEPLTLQFVFEDYLAHMLHHLQHIGIEVDDIKLNHTTTA